MQPVGSCAGASGTPGPSKYQPTLDIEVPTQLFDIGERMSRRVRAEIDLGLARVRHASSRSALIEQNDPIDAWIKGPPGAWGASRAQSVVEHKRGLAGWISARHF
jgi:hypothetical protein